MAAETPSRSIIICSTPRTGSTLLCALLTSTGIGGQPQSYFRKEDAALWATRWGIPVAPDGSVSFPAFLKGALSAGQSENGVFAARIMWGTMEEVVDNLVQSGAAAPGPDIAVLRQAFGPVRFICLRRNNTLAQAVSWARAEQTHVWHRLAGQDDPKQAAREPVYDFSEIDTLVETIGAHNKAWRAWFDANGVTPHTLTYEDLDADPVAVTRHILSWLGLDARKADKIEARNIRLADHTTLDWIARYRRDAARRRSDS